MAEELAALLGAALSADNETRKLAEARIALLSKEPGVVPALLELLQAAPDPRVRQLAAILLRKRVTPHWLKLPEPTREALKATLLIALVREACSPVRRACADVVSKVAKLTLPTGQWPALLPFLHACTQNADELQRELALTVFLSLTEELGDILRPHFAALTTVFGGALSDASPLVRSGALQATAALALQVQSEAEVAAVAALVPAMLAAGRASLAAGDEDGAQLLFSVLDDLVESPAPLLQGHLPALLELSLGVATHAATSASTRAPALALVVALAVNKPHLLRKQRLLEPLLRALCPLCALVGGFGGEEEEPDEAEDDERAAQDAIHGLACQAVEELCGKLQSKHVLPTIMAFASANMGAPDPAARRAGISALASAVEGCCSALRPQSATLVPFIAAALADPSHQVRAAAAEALGHLAVHCSPDALEAHAAAMPALLNALGEAPPAGVNRLLYALDAWMECLESDELAPYLPRFLEHVIALLDSPAVPLRLKEMTLSAAAAAAASAGQAFHPCLPALLPRLHACLCITDDAGLRVRARALECLAMLISAPGGRDAFAPLLSDAMAAADAGFALDYPELREYGHGFYAAVASATGAQFAPWLGGVVVQALYSLALDDGMAFGKEDASDSDEDEDGGADEDDAGALRSFSVRTGVLDEKSAAACALGEYALHCGPAFTPHVAQALPVLLRMTRYFHAQVRGQAYEASGRCVANAFAAGAPLAQPELDQALSTLALGAQQDHDKAAAAAAMEAAASVLRSAGRGRVQPAHLEQLADAALAVLTRKAVCQQDGDGDASDGGSEDEADAEEGEELLMSALTELLPALAATMEHAAFLPCFSEHFRALMTRGRAAAPDSERAEVSAILVEVAVQLGPAAAPCGPVAMPFAVRELGCKDSTNRRNAVFLAGVLVQASGAALAPQLPPLLQALWLLLDAAEPDAAVRDNAAAAATRILLGDIPALPRRELLLALLSALPLQADKEEAPVVYGGLCALLRRGDAELTPFVPRIVQIFGEFAAQAPPDAGDRAAKADATARADVGATLAAMLASPAAAQLQQLLGALPPAHAQALATLAGV